MAQVGFTPILIYSSTTASQAPAAGGLTNSTLGSELAINITDGKLFYKDNANAIQVIAWKVTPTTAGGTGLTSYTAGDMVYWASGTTFTKLAIGAAGYWMSSSGTAPQWNAPAALTKTDDTNVTLTLGGSASTALLNAASLTLGWTGQLAVTRGGTGLATIAQGDILYGSAANTLAALAKNTNATRYLSNTGATNNPAWAQVDLTNGVTGTLPTANGGTGNTTGAATAITSNATTGIMQITGPGAGTTRVMTIPNANFTAARTDAAQTFTGTQTFSADGFFNTVRLGLGASSIADNLACGTDVFAFVTSGARNTAVGWRGGFNTTSGSDNVAVGYIAAYNATTGSNNTAIGESANQANVSGSSNTAVGSRALYLNTAGQQTAVGAQALYSATGASNVGVGYAAGDTITTGTSNTYVGHDADASANNVTNEHVFGQGLTGKGSNTAFIGGTSGAYNAKNVTTWETTSDARIKKNIADNFEGLARIKAIRVRNFEYRKPEEITELPASAAIDKAGVQLGVIAQEMLPECVTENSTGVKSVNTDALIWYLVNAVKELSAQVDALKKQ